MPFTDVALTAIQSEMFLHNKKILIKFCLEYGNSTVSNYFMNEKTGDVKTGSVTNNMNKLWGTSTKYHLQLKASIVSSLSHTRIATPETRRYRSCVSITLWSSRCSIPCFIFTLEKKMRKLYSSTTITNYLLQKWMMIRWICTLKLTVTIPISLGCGWVMEEKFDEKLLLGDVGKNWCKTSSLFKLVEFIFSMSLKPMYS